MLAEVDRFHKWLRRKSPHTSTALHYTSDVQLFFHWADQPPSAIALHEVDAFIEPCQQQGHTIATVNRRLAALHSFYHFLGLDSDNAPPNPVLPKRHFIQPGRRLPRDVEGETLIRLFALITDRRNRAMFLLMVRAGLRVGEVRNLSPSDLYLQPPGLPRLWLHGNGT